MSDERLRELERLTRAGDPAARGEWLRARVRAGADVERIELAARCGEPAAQAALGREAGPLLDAQGLACELERAGREAVLRAALGLAMEERSLRRLARYVSQLYLRLLQAALAVAEVPGDEARRGRVARVVGEVTVPLIWSRWQQSREGLLALGAARCAAAPADDAALRAWFELLHAAFDPAAPGDPAPRLPARWQTLEEGEALGTASPQAALALLQRDPLALGALRAGLAGWALGEPPIAADALPARFQALRG